jgi:hypothetical protein
MSSLQDMAPPTKVTNLAAVVQDVSLATLKKMALAILCL